VISLRLLSALNTFDSDEIDSVCDLIEAGSVTVKTEDDLITGLRYAPARRLWPNALPVTES
jgi:hypothetical protein